MDQNWNISFDGCFFENHSTKRGSKEIKINKIFDWDGQNVHIPSIYLSTKGLIVDILLETDKEKVWKFIEKFDLINDEYGSSLTKDQRDELERENPLHFSFNTTIMVNKKLIKQCRGSACTWIPNLPEEKCPSQEAKEAIDHYGMDPEKAWSVHRVRFEWATVKRPNIKDLSIMLSSDKSYFPAEHFKNPLKGDIVKITDPTNGNEYKLTVEDIEKYSLGNLHLDSNDKELPKNYTVISYVIEPDIGMEEFHLDDCIESDFVRVSPSKDMKNADERAIKAESIGIIGGIDGPIAVLTASVPNKRTATSSIHFDTEYDIEWRAIFRKKLKSDVVFKLI